MPTFLLFLGALAAAAPLSALTVVPATLDELVRESVAVVHGRVREVQGHWTADRRTIESTVTLDVVDALKGTATDTTSFSVPGGTAGGRILVMPGAPTFHVGDEVVVFLRGSAPALPQPVGLSIGVYRVSRAAGATAMVVPSPIHAAATATRVVRGGSARQVRTLSAFAADVRARGGVR